MPKTINLASKIEDQLPAELIDFMRTAGEVVQGQGQSLYLVGGVARDLLLGRTNFDLDLVVEGDAIELARHLAESRPGKITTHPRFGTAKIQWNEWSVDLTTARSETYARPGALPKVKPSSLSDDLLRRDFTINAMAVHLNPADYGKLIDPYRGRDDLKHRLIRVLHERSFIDDATRIWRGLRYEQRLDFRLEANTLKLLKRDIPMLATISGDRIRYELECILQEERPEKVLRRAGALNVLQKLDPALEGNGWLEEKFKLTRKLTSPSPPPFGLYMALLTYRLTDEQAGRLISYLRLPKSVARILQDTHALKARLQALAKPGISPSNIYHLLHGYSPPAIMANSLAGDSAAARQQAKLFLIKLRYIKPSLNGEDLIRIGIPAGPQIKEALLYLHEARLDGKVTSRQAEVDLVKQWLAGKQKP